MILTLPCVDCCLSSSPASPGLLSEGLLSMVIFGPAFPTYGGVFVEFPTMDMASKVSGELC